MKTASTLLFLALFMLSISNAAFADTNEEVKAWAQNAASEIMTFNFNNFETRAQDNKRFFTPKGYKSFSVAMERALIPKIVAENKLMAETQVLCPPEIAQSPTVNQNYWILKIPLKTTWTHGKKAITDYTRATAKISSAAGTSPGYGIEQWITFPISEEESKVCSD